MVASHYDVLNLPSTATVEEIKRSFRRLARECHPDVIGWKDPTKLEWAESRFKRISHARDVLIDPVKRSNYDKTRESRQPDMYSYSYGFVYADSDVRQLTGAYFADYDLAWDEFISKPFGWVEKGLRFYYRWEFVLGVVMVAGFVVWLLLGYEFSTLELMRFMVTTRSAPTVESFIPFQMALTGVMWGVVLTAIATVYAIFMHPYSRRHSLTFRHQLFEQTSNMLAISTLVGGYVGATVGHFLF
jgi:hypothetical protein